MRALALLLMTLTAGVAVASPAMSPPAPPHQAAVAFAPASPWAQHGGWRLVAAHLPRL